MELKEHVVVELDSYRPKCPSARVVDLEPGRHKEKVMEDIAYHLLMAVQAIKEITKPDM